MAVDPVWAGVVGTAVGAVAGSASSLLAPLINWKTEKKRLEVEVKNAKELADHQHKLDVERVNQEAAAAAIAAKRDLVASWRQGVADALRDFLDATEKADDRNSRGLGWELKPAPVVGTPWFETLRPYLDDKQAEVYNSFILPSEVIVTEMLAKRLSAEVTRIARDWKV